LAGKSHSLVARPHAEQLPTIMHRIEQEE